jgi:ribosomal protein L9
MIADALRAQGVKVEAKAVEIPTPIKEVGTFEVVLALHRDVRPALKVWVLSTKAVKPAADGKSEPPAKA